MNHVGSARMGARAAAIALAVLSGGAGAAGAASVRYFVGGNCIPPGGCTTLETLSGGFVLDTGQWVAGAPLDGAVSQLSLQFGAAQPTRFPNVAYGGIWSREPQQMASFTFTASSAVGPATGTVWTLSFAGEGTDFDGFGTETTPASCVTSTCAELSFGAGFATRFYTTFLTSRDTSPDPVPLPAAGVLLGAGLAALGGLRAAGRRARRAAGA